MERLKDFNYNHPMQQALYRKYRPANFKEVLGQEHIVSVLESETKNSKFSHAYLFAGSRGTGKTTLARIFAHAIGIHNEDIYEIDAASNRGIDDVRAIRDAVNVLPYSSTHKVYIVDEAHMLTRDAWNAFLKTLEEPPEHVLFIMATTEMHKLPDTVISRCEVFTFRRPSHSILTETILRTAKAEGFSIEKPSAALIATLAEGSFRDALSILQKAINSSGDKKLSHAEVERVLGAPKSDFIFAILEALGEQAADKALGAVKSATDTNTDMQVFLKMLVGHIRFILLIRFAKEMQTYVKEEVGEEDFEKLGALAKSARNINSKTLLNFLEAISLQRYADIPELPIELAIIESCGGESSQANLL